MKKTIVLSCDQMHTGNLILVNSNYMLQLLKPIGLMPVTAKFPDVLLKREASNMIRLIFDRISCGDQIIPVSGYRLEREQKEIYTSAIRNHGMDFTKKYVARPNCSEHQTGLAIDLGHKQDIIDFIRPAFPDHGICQSFRQLAPSYGFIERYPKNKEGITGIAHEPWHFRYVGYPHAQLMGQYGFALEEYIAFLKDFTMDCPYIFQQSNSKQIRIFYVAGKAEYTTISLPEEAVYLISGNNVDGFIVTLWSD